MANGGHRQRKPQPKGAREITMLMKRTFFLACATVVALGISAASSTPAHARRCSDADTDREEAVCLIRGAVYKAKAAAAQAQQMQKMHWN